MDNSIAASLKEPSPSKTYDSKEPVNNFTPLKESFEGNIPKQNQESQSVPNGTFSQQEQNKLNTSPSVKIQKAKLNFQPGSSSPAQHHETQSHPYERKEEAIPPQEESGPKS